MIASAGSADATPAAAVNATAALPTATPNLVNDSLMYRHLPKLCTAIKATTSTQAVAVSGSRLPGPANVLASPPLSQSAAPVRLYAGQHLDRDVRPRRNRARPPGPRLPVLNLQSMGVPNG